MNCGGNTAWTRHWLHPKVSDGAGGEVFSLVIARRETLWKAAANTALHPVIVGLLSGNALLFHILGGRGENLKEPLQLQESRTWGGLAGRPQKQGKQFPRIILDYLRRPYCSLRG